MKLMTSERCPECGQIIYIEFHRKQLDNDLIIGDGCYLDKDGCLIITRFDDETLMPDYVCIHCNWIA